MAGLLGFPFAKDFDQAHEQVLPSRADRFFLVLHDGMFVCVDELLFILAEHGLEEAIGKLFVVLKLVSQLHVVPVKPLVANFDGLDRVHVNEVPDVLTNELLHLDIANARGHTTNIEVVGVFFLLDGCCCRLKRAQVSGLRIRRSN